MENSQKLHESSLGFCALRYHVKPLGGARLTENQTEGSEEKSTN